MKLDYFKALLMIPLLMFGGVEAQILVMITVFGVLVVQGWRFLQFHEDRETLDFYWKIRKGTGMLVFVAFISSLLTFFDIFIFQSPRFFLTCKYFRAYQIFDYDIYFFLTFFSAMLTVMFVLLIMGLRRRMADRWFKKLYLAKEA